MAHSEGSQSAQGSVERFDWQGLARLSAEQVRVEQRGRHALGLIRWDAVRAACADLCAVEVGACGPGQGVPLLACAEVTFELGGHLVRLRVEPEAAAFLLRRVLRRPAGLDGGGRLPESLAGAWAALVLELVRRGAQQGAPRLVPAGHAAPMEWQRSFWATLDGRNFGGELAVTAGEESIAPLRPPGALRLCLPWVVGHATLLREELAALRVGDTWLPGDDWWIDPASAGRALAIAPAAEYGFEFELGEVATFRGLAALPHEPGQRGDWDKEMSMSEEQAEEIVMQAPVVVRIEVASITLTGAEWLALQPGDVVRAGVEGSPKVSLRVAGERMAEGELVTVDGELGVRITRLADAGLP